MKLFTSLVIFSSSAESYNSWNSRNTPDCTKSQTGKSCLPWDSRRNYTLKCNGRIAPGGCSNPDNDSKGPWCYTGYGTTNHYEYCDPRCSSHNVCSPPTTTTTTTTTTILRPVDKCNKTRTGKRCRFWSESVHLSRVEQTKMWMRNQNHNNCANPDNDSRGKWCFITATSGAKNYDYCPENCATESEPSVRPPIRPPTPPRPPSAASCAPEEQEFLQFRDDQTGRVRRPSTWQIADQIPMNSLNRVDVLYGKKALKGLIPWQVQLIGPFLCGGTIASPRIVITANHCVAEATNPRQWSVQAGHIKKSNSWSVPDDAQRKQVIEIVEHPDFNRPRELNNDIAIMVTDSAFQFNEYVRPACLPPKNFKPVGGDCIISGFGHTASGGKASKDLLWTLIPLIDRQTCSRKLRTRLTDNMICGGGAGPDTCQGDSGGPLVCAYRHPSGQKQYVLVGVTSWGFGCGETPGVYCEVSDHLDWINQISSQYN